MNRRVAGVLSACGSVLMSATVAMANAPSGDHPPDYSGITGLYYTIIGIILLYGVYDTFLKKS